MARLRMWLCTTQKTCAVAALKHTCLSISARLAANDFTPLKSLARGSPVLETKVCKCFRSVIVPQQTGKGWTRRFPAGSGMQSPRQYLESSDIVIILRYALIVGFSNLLAHACKDRKNERSLHTESVRRCPNKHRTFNVLIQGLFRLCSHATDGCSLLSKQA